MKWSLIHPQRRRLSAVVCKLRETESEGNYSFRDRLIMHYSLGRHCPLPILLNHLTVAHCWWLANRHSVLCHLCFYFSIISAFLRVGHMILKKKKEEEEEEKKGKSSSSSSDMLLDWLVALRCLAMKFSLLPDVWIESPWQADITRCLTKIPSLLLQNFILFGALRYPLKRYPLPRLSCSSL